MSAPPLLELRQVRRRLSGREVLSGADLWLAPRGRLTIAGRSGAGKTTLLRLVAGLDAPDGGEIWLDGALASAAGRAVTPPWRRGVQMVFQDLALWPTRTVLQNVADPLRAQGLPRAEARRRATELLARLGLADPHLRRKPGTLSGGEARRLAFARAVAPRPRLLLLDEPFGSLDPVARADGFALLEDVLAWSDAAVILVTHEPEEARALGGLVSVLKDGRLEPPRPCEELCSSPAAFRASLET